MEINQFDLGKIYERTKLIIGEDNLQKLKKSKVCICGIGGVGSYALEALARTGIGTLEIIDKDIVDITNINRQIIADTVSVGQNKVDYAKERVGRINPNINVITEKVAISGDNVEKLILKDTDYVIDAIDDIEGKVAIIKYCTENNIKIISSMGMANKLNPCDIKVTDIYKTAVCPLAKIMRKRLKEMGIKKLKVAYSDETPIKNENNILGSVSFVPGTAGLILASEVAKDIIK